MRQTGMSRCRDSMMNKRKAVYAALCAACFWPGLAWASEPDGQILWVLTGSAADAEGEARRVVVTTERPQPEEAAEAAADVPSPAMAETAPAPVPEAAEPDAAPAAPEAEPALIGTVAPAPETADAAPVEAYAPEAAAPAAATAPEEPAQEAAPSPNVVYAVEVASDTTVSEEPASDTIPSPEAPASEGAVQEMETSAAPTRSTMESMSFGEGTFPDEEREDIPEEYEEDSRDFTPLFVAADDTPYEEDEDDYIWGMVPMEISETADLGDEPVWNDERRRTEIFEQLAIAGREAQSQRRRSRDEEEGGSSVSPANPVILSADSMAYRGATGDVDLRGHVVVNHMRDRYVTDHIYGNTVERRYVAPGKVYVYNPGNRMSAESATYDANTSIGTFETLTGWNRGKYYYQGDSGVYDRNENKITVQKGYFTTKHAVAKVPDYRIEAESIDIYPNDHYKAHNASLYFKNAKIITLSSYSGSLRDGSSLMTLVPTPTYDSDNGWGLKNRLTLPIGGSDSDLSFDARFAWYSKEGFKPDVGLRLETGVGTFRLRYAEEESTVNDYNVWLKKKPTLSFDSRRFYIPNTDFYVGARGDISEWEETRSGREISGSHMKWDVYLSHNPIPFGPHMKFFWRLGYMRDYYGYNDTIRGNRYYTLGLRAKYGMFSPWVIYTDRNLSGRSPYRYDTYSMDKPVNTGIRLQLTPLDAVSVSFSIDTIDGELEHRYFTYYRDMHSFYAWIRYDNIEKEYKFMIMPKDFKF